MAGAQRRITIGFRGQALAVRADDAAVEQLMSALRGGQAGWHDLATDDGTLALDLGKVEFVRIDAQDQRVGFAR